jgi:hypothetical protein
MVRATSHHVDTGGYAKGCPVPNDQGVFGEQGREGFLQHRVHRMLPGLPVPIPRSSEHNDDRRRLEDP